MMNKTKTILLIGTVFWMFIMTSSTMADKAYFNNGDGTVTDLSTGLTWQQILEPLLMQMTWEDALAYCENLEGLSGKSDWRLPSANELFSLVDFSKFRPAINTNYFQYGTGNNWSSTTYEDQRWYAWSVDFSSHDVMEPVRKSKIVFTRCVRGRQ